MSETIATARTVARELLDSGHPRGAAAIFELIASVEGLTERLQHSANDREAVRLRAVIRNALPHQTNAEVARWLQAALAGGTSEIFDNQGRRVDQ